MRTRLFEGRVYIKASELARQYHYTADYLGQLARQEKVKARLAGRSWYIEESSLLAYKKRDMVTPVATPPKPRKARTETKDAKPIPKRTTKKKRVRTTEQSEIVLEKKRRRVPKTSPSTTKISEATVQVKPVVPPLSAPRESAKTGLFEKAAGWLRKLKGG